jgi:hypothetical protein
MIYIELLVVIITVLVLVIGGSHTYAWAAIGEQE